MVSASIRSLGLASLLVVAAPPLARAQTVTEPNFAAEVLYRGNGMITVGFGPGGRLYVCEKQGRILLFSSNGLGGFNAPTVFADLTAAIDDAQESGLLGLALDPSFATNRRMYLFYTTTTDQRVVRVEADASYDQMVTGSEVVLLSGLPRMSGTLKGGGIELHPNEPDVLYVGVGTDSLPSQSQQLTAYQGKMLRISKETGLGLPDNPYQDGNMSSVRSRLWSVGLRNPFRFAFHPDVPNPNVIYLSENGQGTDRLSWMSRGSNGSWGALGDNGGFLAPPDVNHHVMLTSAPYRSGVDVIRGGPFADADFPGSDALYEARISPATGVGTIYRWRLTGANLDTLTPMAADTGGVFANSAVGIDLRFGPEGSMYLTQTVTGPALSPNFALVRIRFTGGLDPIAGFTTLPDPPTGASPLAVSFTDTSTDPEGALFGWSWSFGDGGTSIEQNPTHTYTTPGSYTVTLTVTDAALRRSTTQATITVTEPDLCSPPPLCDDGDACNGVETCDSLIGCVPGVPPACDDLDACNGVESCDPVEGCVAGTPLTCDDLNTCTVDACVPASGCTVTLLADGTPCGDPDVCNGVEVCLEGSCAPSLPPVCDDLDACNGAESCDSLLGCLAGIPVSCDDADACNGVEVCDPSGACLAGVPVCTALSVAPAALSFTASAGGASPPGQVLQISNAGPADLMAWTASPDAPWLTVSATSGSSSMSTSGSITVSANVAGLAPGTYAGSVLIAAPSSTLPSVVVPVTFEVGPAPGTQLIGNGGFEGGLAPWFLFGTAGSYSASGASPHGGSGHVTFSLGSGGNAVLAQVITLPAGASTTLSFWLQMTTSETTTTLQNDRLTVRLTTNTGAPLVTLATYSNLDAAAHASYVEKTFDVSAYAGQTVRVVMDAVMNASLATTFYVDDASALAGTPTLALAPASLAFAAEAGTAAPAQAIAIANTGAGTLSFSASTSAPWLTVSPSSGAAPAELSVVASAVGLPPGTYSADVTVTAAGATGSPGVVPVSFTVAAGPPALSVAPSSISFSVLEGGAAPAPLALAIDNTGGGVLDYEATTDAPWLTIAPASGSAPAIAEVSVSIAGLSSGTHSANVIITAAGANGSPATIPVTLEISAEPPAVSVSPAALYFAASAGGAAPEPRTLSVANGGGGTVALDVISSAPWISVDPSSGVAPFSVSVSVDQSTLVPGSHSAELTLSPVGGGGALVVPVTFVVHAVPGTEHLVNGGLEGAIAPWLLFGSAAQYVASGATPHTGSGYVSCGAATGSNAVFAQVVTIPAGVQSATLRFWLQLSTTETTTLLQNDRLTARLTTNTGAALATLATYSNLDAAAHASYVEKSFDVTAYAGQTLRVVFDCVMSSSLVTTFLLDDLSLRSGGPVLFALPSSVELAAAEGGAPVEATVSITNAGLGSLAYTTSSGAPWLSVSPSSGAAPSELLVTADPTGLAPGLHSGAVTISAAGASGSPLELPVNLTITGASATLVVAPSALELTAIEGGFDPDSVSIALSAIGGSATFSATADVPWLSVAPASGAVPATLDVAASIAGLAPGLHVGNVVITSPEAASSPVLVPVSLLVEAAGVEVLVNGDFESGVITPWLRFGTAATLSTAGGTPHAGAGYMVMGGVDSGTGLLAQQPALPAGVTSLTLGFWLSITTAETTTTLQNDRLTVKLQATNGALLATFATYSNLDASTFATYQERTFDLTPWAGQTVRIVFEAVASSSLVTTFNVDDVSVISR